MQNLDLIPRSSRSSRTDPLVARQPVSKRANNSSNTETRPPSRRGQFKSSDKLECGEDYPITTNVTLSLLDDCSPLAVTIRLGNPSTAGVKPRAGRCSQFRSDAVPL